jgi:hypothetical protein
VAGKNGSALTRKELDELAVGMPYRAESKMHEVRAWLAEYRPRALARAEGRDYAEAAES